MLVLTAPSPRNLTCLAMAGGMPGNDQDSGLGGAITRNRASPQLSVGSNHVLTPL